MAPKSFLILAAAVFSAALCSCSSSSGQLSNAKVYKAGAKPGAYARAGTYVKPGTSLQNVRTTAYSHVEADSLQYGRANAAGGTLKYGMVRSAAADWSEFPLGTVFKIDGLPYVYEIDDYGSALVGTKTIDLYKPGFAGIKEWGARNVNIKIIKWGSYADSLAILNQRLKHPHVRAMAVNINKKARG